MHKKIICFLALLTILIGCSNLSNSPSNLNENQKKAIALFTKDWKMPFKIDSSFMQKMDTNNLMNYKILHSYFQSNSNDSLSQEIVFPLERTCFIDSIKQTKGYKSFIDSLDIGMIQNASAFPLGKILLKNDTYLLLWALCYTSYEACPIFSGTLIIGSSNNKQGTFTNYLLAKNYSLMDPPGFVNSHINAIIYQDSLIINAIQTEDDDADVSGYNLSIVKYKYDFLANDIKLLNKHQVL